MQHTTYLELEQEISKMVRVMTTRDTRIGGTVITDLLSRFALEHVAGILLVSLERLIWLDAAAFVWTVENLIPIEVMQEIRRITSVTMGKRLVDQGMIPGQDFSVDSTGKLLLNARAKTVVFQG